MQRDAAAFTMALAQTLGSLIVEVANITPNPEATLKNIIDRAYNGVAKAQFNMNSPEEIDNIREEARAYLDAMVEGFTRHYK